MIDMYAKLTQLIYHMIYIFVKQINRTLLTELNMGVDDDELV